MKKDINITDVSYDEAWSTLSKEQHDTMRAWYTQVTEASKEETNQKRNADFVRSWHASLFALTPFAALFALYFTHGELGIKNMAVTILSWLICAAVFSFLRAFYEKFGEKTRDARNTPSTILFIIVELVACVFASAVLVGLFR